MSTKPSSEETADLQGAFPRLSEAQIAALGAQGQRRPIQPGDVLFAEGDRESDFFVILAGKVASVEGKGTSEERVIAVPILRPGTRAGKAPAAPRTMTLITAGVQPKNPPHVFAQISQQGHYGGQVQATKSHAEPRGASVCLRSAEHAVWAAL